MDDEKASSEPRREGEVTPRRARSAPPALFVEPKTVAPEADPLPIDVPEAVPIPRRRAPRARKATPPPAETTPPPAETTSPTAKTAETIPPPAETTSPTAEAAEPPVEAPPAPAAETSTAPSDTPTEVAPPQVTVPAPRRAPDRGDWRARTPKPVPTWPSQADLWTAVRTRPALAPAALAIVAVDRFGPAAQHRARWLTATYPHVPAHRLARAAVRDATTRSRYAAAASLVPLGGMLGLSTQLWAHARMVLEIAAAFDHDPCADERAADLLTLLRVYPDERSARGAVATLTTVATAPGDLPASGDPADAGFKVARKPVVGAAGAQLARRAARRWFPGSALVLDGLSTASATEALANRAIRFYRSAPHR